MRVDIQAAYQALADPTRRRILELLREGEMAAGELAQYFETSWPAVSRHLTLLRSAGLVTSRREQRKVLYTTNDEMVATLEEDLHRLTRTQVPRSRRPGKSFEIGLSVQVRAATAAARQEAAALGHARVGSHHLLLGILDADDGVGARALAASGVTADAVRQKVVELFGAGDSTDAEKMPFEWEAKALLGGAALGEALRLRRRSAGTGELLLAMLREWEQPLQPGKAAQVLDALGVDLDGLRVSVLTEIAAMTEGDPDEQPEDVPTLDQVASNLEFTWHLFVTLERKLSVIEERLEALSARPRSAPADG